MITVTEAEKIILSTPFKKRTTTIPLQKARGRVLQEDVFADSDFPPFNRVMMDGIAVRYAEFEKGRRVFKVEGIQAAGTPQLSLESHENCLEVMTGAVLPGNTDTVIPYENIRIDQGNNVAEVNVADVTSGGNVHAQGTDKKKGDRLIESGVKISAAEIAMMASVGKTEIKVSQNPRMAIISTGNELVDINEKPMPHQIRRSNVYALQAEVNSLGLAADLYHIDDDKNILITELEKILSSHDVLLLSGGVSMGKFDYIPDVLEKLGVEKRFHKVKQKPGKPFWFGNRGDEKVVFAFPGNPVSTFMCFHRYFVPWFSHVSNSPAPKEFASLSEDFTFNAGLTYFLQVKIHSAPDGKLVAVPVKGKGSGDHANLLEADGFLELPGETNEFKKNQGFQFYRYR